MPRLPKLPKRPPSPIGPIRDIIHQAREQVKQAGDDIRSIATEIRGTENPPESKPAESKREEEECPVCSDLTDLKEYLGKRKVKKALSELEKGEGDKEKSLETVRKYIEGEDIA